MPEDTIFSPQLSDTVEKYMPFLMEIRKRLLFIVAVFIAAAAFGFLYYERMVKLILSIFNLQGVNIVFTSPFQFMELAISSALLIGILVVLPLIIMQFLSFIKRW